MPLNLSKLKELIDELKEKEMETPLASKYKSEYAADKTLNSKIFKKNHLLPTEKKAYFDISHHFQLVTYSIDDLSVAYEIWIKGILPLILPIHGIDFDEWDRICDLGDSDPELIIELNEDWKKFLQTKVKKGLINENVLELILEGKRKIKKNLM